MLSKEVPSSPLLQGPFFLLNSSLRSEDLHPARGVAGSGFRPLSNIPTAASRRSLGRVSVPVWLIILSDQLSVVVLVSRYLTNKLMERRLLLRRFSAILETIVIVSSLPGISHRFQWLSLTEG